jgi:tRNA-dihydrouridine synthase B
MPRLIGEGSGAALVKAPALVHDLLAAMVAETDLPVTLKTRPGPRTDKVMMLELLDAAETAGAKGIILHARFTSQSHGGDVHLDLLSELVRAAKIPVAGNGGVVDAATARAMAETGVSSIMIGRAALTTPYIFQSLKAQVPQTFEPSTLFREHLDALIALHAQTAANFPDDRLPTLDAWVTVAVRTHLMRYFHGIPGAAKIRRQLASVGTLAEIESLIMV